MGVLDKMIMKMFAIILDKTKNKSAEDICMQNSIRKSYDISNKSRIKTLVDYIKSL